MFSSYVSKESSQKSDAVKYYSFDGGHDKVSEIDGAFNNGLFMFILASWLLLVEVMMVALVLVLIPCR